MTKNGQLNSLQFLLRTTTDYGINQQVVHQVLQPIIARRAIEQNWTQPNNTCDEEQSIDTNNYPSYESDDGDSTTASPGNDNESTTRSDEDDQFYFDDLIIETNKSESSCSQLDTSLNDREIKRRSKQPTALKPNLQVEIELINLMSKNKMLLNAFKSIFDWARRSQSRQDFDFCSYETQKRETVFKDIRKNLDVPEKMEFHPQTIPLLPDGKATQIYIRLFHDVLYFLLTNQSLTKEVNLSVPNSKDPCSGNHYPDITTTSTISQLHHGSWWSESWKDAMSPNATNEMLVPIILYMDGISLDAHGRLSLCPLNLTLGIFTVEARKLPEAWETIYFHPDTEFESSHHSRKPTATENIQNLHNGLDKALESFRKASELEHGIQ